MSEMKTGGQIIWESLMQEGVEVVFGSPAEQSCQPTMIWQNMSIPYTMSW
jgi:thiamine pyrophosphate-dependent acetolactate synthase large subunit-like protein